MPPLSPAFSSRPAGEASGDLPKPVELASRRLLKNARRTARILRRSRFFSQYPYKAGSRRVSVCRVSTMSMKLYSGVLDCHGEMSQAWWSFLVIESRPSLRSATKVSFSPKPSLVVNLFNPSTFRSEHVLAPSTRLAPVPLDDQTSRIGRFTPSSTEDCRLSVRLAKQSLACGNHEGCLSKVYDSIGQP